LALTDAGGEFYARCEAILAEVDAAEAGVSASVAELSGTIRMAAPLSFGLQHLGPALTRFMAEHPGVHVQVDFNDRQVDLIAEGFDLAIRIAKLGDSTLVARKLTPARIVLCASPAYWQTHGYPNSPADLKEHTALHYTLAAQRNWSYTAPDGSRGSVTVRSHHRANNGSFLAAAAAAGLGIARLPLFIVHTHIERGELQPALTDHVWNDVFVWAVYPRVRSVPARIRLLIDFLAEEFGTTPYWEECLSAAT
jgi:DNA-binding transcriptional LysR family regulator